MIDENIIKKIKEETKKIKLLEEEIDRLNSSFGLRSIINDWNNLIPQEKGPYNRLKKLKKKLRKLKEEKKMKVSIVKDILYSQQKYCNCLITNMFTDEQYECLFVKDFNAIEGKLFWSEGSEELIRVDKVLSEPEIILPVCGYGSI